MGIRRRRIISVLNRRWNAAFAQARVRIVRRVESTAVIALRVVLGGPQVAFARQAGLLCCSQTIPVLIGRGTVHFAFAVLSPKAAHDVTHVICTRVWMGVPNVRYDRATELDGGNRKGSNHISPFVCNLSSNAAMSRRGRW